MNIGFIGLGVMGFPMAGHLHKSKHNVAVFNRSLNKVEKWIKDYEGKAFKNIEDIAQFSDVIILCITKDQDVKEVLIKNQDFSNKLKEGTIIVDHTTTSSDLPIELNKILNIKGIEYLDAPISGGQAGAESGQLSIMIGGNKDAFNKIDDVLNCYSKFTKYMGKSGSGQLTKMVNQICIAGLVQGLAEGLNFSKKAKLNGRKVLDVISKGAAGSWQMDNRGETMLNDEFDFGFAVDWMRKDLNICLDEANNNKAKLPITALINQFYCDLQDMGGGRFDTSSLIKRL